MQISQLIGEAGSEVWGGELNGASAALLAKWAPALAKLLIVKARKALPN